MPTFKGWLIRVLILGAPLAFVVVNTGSLRGP
jgi:hypothetical protein